MIGDKFLELLQKIPQKVKNFNRISMGIAVAIDDKLKSQGMTQKILADRLGKKESEISKWLSGKHNFTIKSIANIEAALAIEIITINSFQNLSQAPLENHKGEMFKNEYSPVDFQTNLNYFILNLSESTFSSKDSVSSTLNQRTSLSILSEYQPNKYFKISSIK